VLTGDLGFRRVGGAGVVDPGIAELARGGGRRGWSGARGEDAELA
jgi:hypothetical protein